MRRALTLLAVCLPFVGCGEPPRGHADAKPPKASASPRTAGPVTKIPMH